MIETRFADELSALQVIIEGTASETGEAFFRALVKNLSTALNVSGAWVTEYLETEQRLRAHAFWLNGKFVSHYEYNISGTPCEPVITTRSMFHVPERVIELFPDDPDLAPMNAVSYKGAPLLDLDGNILGHLAVLSNRPMPEHPRDNAMFRIFATRAAAELQRLRVETQLKEREEQLNSLLDGAMDAILEIDSDGRITQANPAAGLLLHASEDGLHGCALDQFLTDESRSRLAGHIEMLNSSIEQSQSLWIPAGLAIALPDGEECRTEATLSRHVRRRHVYFILILRNINERLLSEQRIHHLTVQTEYLREELRSLQSFDEIIGESRPLLRVMHQMRQVAATDATVLLLGETGTGKELIARGIHNASKRSKQPLVKLNCAAIPASLIESELFGHEKGAFTGATAQREGRFVIADGGTIFLDEIGEMPLELQTKLLRVLQEGEVEPVGSSHTIHVDVRVVAATNRDLSKEIEQGRFREDLFYRLNVFPIHVPALRERRDDIALLATHFAAKAASKMGVSSASLSTEDIELLRGYNWPGNIRELQNIIERAVITSDKGVLNVARAFPEASAGRNRILHDEMKTPVDGKVYTFEEWKQLERENILCALGRTEWKISGSSGAAALLGIPATTLASRIKALGIRRQQ